MKQYWMFGNTPKVVYNKIIDIIYNKEGIAMISEHINNYDPEKFKEYQDNILREHSKKINVSHYKTNKDSDTAIHSIGSLN